tara:strand:- start:261 stop:464 length:204 start_codon:yes stop_codon:yes gene_type:complete
MNPHEFDTYVKNKLDRIYKGLHIDIESTGLNDNSYTFENVHHSHFDIRKMEKRTRAFSLGINFRKRI